MQWLSQVAVVTSLAVAVGCSVPKRPDGGTGLLAVGSPVPKVTGVDQSGKEHSLADLGGKPTVVYFYPKDGTPGCTKEACAFRDVWNKYEAAGVLVFGVSRDTRESHEKFAVKHSLDFPLIADPQGTWADAFGVGRTAGLYHRVTFLVGRDGKIAKVYPNVDPGVHAGQVLQDVKAL